jgi:hypothetical protein
MNPQLALDVLIQHMNYQNCTLLFFVGLVIIDLVERYRRVQRREKLRDPDAEKRRIKALLEYASRIDSPENAVHLLTECTLEGLSLTDACISVQKSYEKEEAQRKLRRPHPKGPPRLRALDKVIFK